VAEEYRDTEALRQDARQWETWADKCARIAGMTGGTAHLSIGTKTANRWAADDLHSAATRADWSSYDGADTVKEAYLELVSNVAHYYATGSAVMESIARRLLNIVLIVLEAEGAADDEIFAVLRQMDELPRGIARS